MTKPSKSTAYLTGFDVKPKQRNIRAVTLRNIPEPKDRQLAPGCVTLYYGMGNTLKAMATHHRDAISQGMDMYTIAAGVNVGNIIVEFLTFEDLKKTKFMNVERISKEVMAKIEEYWWDYLKSEGKSDDWIKENVEFRRHRFMSDRPDLVAKLAREPEFKHLNLIVHQIVNDGMIIKVGVVTHPDQIKEMVCRTNPNIKVTLEVAEPVEA